MKKIVLLYIILTATLVINAQTIATIRSSNLSTSAVPYNSADFRLRSFHVRFEVQNDSIALIDSFVSNQKRIDTFLHSDLHMSAITIDYIHDSQGSPWFGGYACSPSFSGPSSTDSVFKYTFKLFHKDSFLNKTITYKGNLYTLNNLGNGIWDHSPKEFSFNDSHVSAVTSWSTSPPCPPQIYVSNDSIFISFVTWHVWQGQQQILKEEKFSTTDSFTLRVNELVCGNAVPTASRYYCYTIYMGDTNTTTALDVFNPDYNGNGIWFHYQRNSNGITTKIAAPLPVIGLELEVHKGIYSNDIIWSTLSEKNTSHYNIIKSENGIDYKTIGSINAAGNTEIFSNYSYIDDRIEKKKDAYYRIDLIDIDLKTTSSNTAFIAGKNNSEFSISPNPSSGIVNIQGIQYEPYMLKLSTIDGKFLLDERIEAQQSEYQINLNQFPSGIYILSLRNLETGGTLVKQITKN